MPIFPAVEEGSLDIRQQAPAAMALRNQVEGALRAAFLARKWVHLQYVQSRLDAPSPLRPPWWWTCDRSISSPRQGCMGTAPTAIGKRGWSGLAADDEPDHFPISRTAHQTNS